MATAKTGRETKRKEEEARSTTDEGSVTFDERGRAEIESRAYEIYLARGAVHGYDQDDWLQAEREFKEAQS